MSSFPLLSFTSSLREMALRHCVNILCALCVNISLHLLCMKLLFAFTGKVFTVLNHSAKVAKRNTEYILELQ